MSTPKNQDQSAIPPKKRKVTDYFSPVNRAKKNPSPSLQSKMPPKFREKLAWREAAKAKAAASSDSRPSISHHPSHAPVYHDEAGPSNSSSGPHQRCAYDDSAASYDSDLDTQRIMISPRSTNKSKEEELRDKSEKERQDLIKKVADRYAIKAHMKKFFIEEATLILEEEIKMKSSYFDLVNLLQRVPIIREDRKYDPADELGMLALYLAAGGYKMKQGGNFYQKLGRKDLLRRLDILIENLSPDQANKWYQKIHDMKKDKCFLKHIDFIVVKGIVANSSRDKVYEGLAEATMVHACRCPICFLIEVEMNFPVLFDIWRPKKDGVNLPLGPRQLIDSYYARMQRRKAAMNERNETSNEAKRLADYIIARKQGSKRNKHMKVVFKKKPRH